MVLKPYEEAKSSIASLDVQDARECGFIGDGAYLMHNLLSNGQLMQLVITGYDEQAEGSWTRTVTAAEIEALCEGWPEDLRAVVIEVRYDQNNSLCLLFTSRPAKS